MPENFQVLLIIWKTFAIRPSVYWILNYNLPPFAGSADFFYLTSAYLAGYLVAYQWIYKSP